MPTSNSARAALRTFAERFLAGEIHRRGSFAVLALLFLAKIKFHFEFGRQFDDGSKWKSLLATKALQRADFVCRG